MSTGQGVNFIDYNTVRSIRFNILLIVVFSTEHFLAVRSHHQMSDFLIFSYICTDRTRKTIVLYFVYIFT